MSSSGSVAETGPPTVSFSFEFSATSTRDTRVENRIGVYVGLNPDRIDENRPSSVCVSSDPSSLYVTLARRNLPSSPGSLSSMFVVSGLSATAACGVYVAEVAPWMITKLLPSEELNHCHFRPVWPVSGSFRVAVTGLPTAG